MNMLMAVGSSKKPLTPISGLKIILSTCLEDPTQAEEMQCAVIASNEELHEAELADLTGLVQALHQSYFGKFGDTES